MNPQYGYQVWFYPYSAVPDDSHFYFCLSTPSPPCLSLPGRWEFDTVRALRQIRLGFSQILSNSSTVPNPSAIDLHLEPSTNNKPVL